MFCPFCGKEVKDESKFCPFCGKSMPQATKPSPEVASVKAEKPAPKQTIPVKKKSKLVPILIAILAGGLLVCGITAGIIIALVSYKNSPIRMVKEAERYLASNETDKAIEKYNEAISSDPTNEDAYIGLSSIYVEKALDATKEDKLDDAKKWYQDGLDVLKKYPNVEQSSKVKVEVSTIKGYIADLDAEIERIKTMAQAEKEEKASEKESKKEEPEEEKPSEEKPEEIEIKHTNSVGKVTPFSSLTDNDDTLTIYCWNDEFMNYVTDFMPGYTETDNPDVGYLDGVKVEWVMVPADGYDYQNAVDKALTGNKDIDIFLLEADYAGKYIDSDVVKPLGALGISDEDVKYQYNYTQQVVSRDGIIYGSSHQAYGSGMIYDRKIAKEVLGTDDPAKVQEMVSDWNKWYEVAEKIKASGYLMTTCPEATYRIFDQNKYAPWVDSNGDINLDPHIQNWVNINKNLLDGGMTSLQGFWDANDEFKYDTTFCVFGPGWYYSYCMQYGSGESIADRGGWGFCMGPQTSFWGGTWVCVADKCNNMQSASKLIKTMTIDENVLDQMHYKHNETINNAKLINNYAEEGNEVYILGNQNPYTVYKDILPLIDYGKSYTYKNKSARYYDYYCSEDIQEAMKKYFRGEMSYEKAEKWFYTAIKERCPELH